MHDAPEQKTMPLALQTYAERLVTTLRHARQLADMVDIYNTVIDAVWECFDVDRISLAIKDASWQGFSLVTERGKAISYQPDALHFGGLADYAFKATVPVFYDLGQGDRFAEDQGRRNDGFQYIGLVPVKVRDETRGALTILSGPDAPFSEDDLMLAEPFAHVLGAAMTLIQDSEMRECMARESTALEDLTKKLTSSLDGTEIASLSAEAIGTYLNASTAVLLANGSELEVVSVHAPDNLREHQTRYMAQRVIGSSSEAIQQILDTKGQRSTGAKTSARMAELPDDEATAIQRTGVSDFLVTPLRWNSELYGAVVTIAHSSEDEAAEDGHMAVFTAMDEHYLERATSHIAPAIATAQSHSDLERALTESEAIREITQLASHVTDEGEGVEMVLRSIALLFNADLVAVAHLEQGRAIWDGAVGNQTSFGTEHGIMTPPPAIGPDPVYDVYVIHDAPALINEDPEAAPFHDAEGLVCSMFCPFTFPNDVQGWLVIGFRKARNLTAADARFADALATGVTATLFARRATAG